jgi:hypothetical protein
MQALDRTRWQAATAGILRIEPLADSVTEQWVTEECPGRLLPDDGLSRATRLARAPKENSAVPNLARKQKFPDGKSRYS